MQGRAFLGKHRQPPEDGVLLYADRFDEIYGMRRGWTDGRWRYIRRFTPHLPAAPYSSYQFGMSSWTAWRKAWLDGKLDERHRRIWEAPQPTEELFDLQNDPWEIHNLAADPAHAERLTAMRERLKAKMAAIKDTGIIPEPMFETLCPDRPVADFARGPGFDHSGVLDLAFTATSASPSATEQLHSALKSEDPVKRHWALLGMRVRGKADGVPPLLDDQHSVNRVLAAEALHAAGQTEAAAKALLAELDRNIGEYPTVHLLNAITRLGVSNQVPDEWLRKAMGKGSGNEYLKRFARQIRNERN
jgi:N-sulfoglucosamine sulfohydrolase